MQRPQLEHIIRAAAGITGAQEFVIIGSQAVLGQFPHAPDELLVSIEAPPSPHPMGRGIKGEVFESSPATQPTAI